jgi:hypothetical protein
VRRGLVCRRRSFRLIPGVVGEHRTVRPRYRSLNARWIRRRR